MSRQPLLLHPATLAALFVLVANDHWFKYAQPGLVSGKASDFAGLVLLPLLIVGTIEVLRIPGLYRASWVVCAATGIAFAAAKLFAGPNLIVDQLLGGQVLVDPWDLIALPALCVPILISRRATPSTHERLVALETGRRH